MILIQYGTPVHYMDKTLIASVTGKGKNVIVMLPGFGSPSPVIEFKALSSFLEEDYTIVTIDYLGYGQSDIPDTERNLENIADEIHHTIKALGYSEYILTAHSLSGIYSLYYANKCPNEVKAFVGIDTSVPQQIDSDVSKIENSKMLKVRQMKHSRLSKLLIRKSAERVLKGCTDYTYSKSDIQAYSNLFAAYINRESLIDEINHFGESFNKLKNAHFPTNIPILFLISDQTVRLMPQWTDWHKELLGGNTGKVISMNGSHYLHLTATKQVAEEINRFIKEL